MAGMQDRKTRGISKENQKKLKRQSQKQKLALLSICIAAALMSGCGAAKAGSEAAKTEAESTAQEENMSESAAAAVQTENEDAAAEQYYKIEFADWFKQFSVPDLNGETVTQDIFKKADVTMINIWGTFCTPCINEMPDLGEINRAYQEKADAEGKVPFQIIGLVGDAIAADENGYPVIDADIKKTAEDIVAKTKADYVHLMPTGNFGLNIMGTGEIQYFPSSIFVDSEGNILQADGSDITVGGHDKAQWESLIEKVLEQVKK